MVDTRDIELGGIWAEGAPDPPATPISETTYADSSIVEATIQEGWPYSKIVDSAIFNEVMRRITSLLILLERNGIMPWSPLTDYEIGATCLGSTGLIYSATNENGPNTTAGVKNPVNYSSYWKTILYDHEQTTSSIHGSTSGLTPGKIIQRDSNGQANVGTPSLPTHIARKQDVDGEASSRASADAAEALARQSADNGHAALTIAHGSTSNATAGTIASRDGVGRLKAVDASAGQELVNFQQFPNLVAAAGVQDIGATAMFAYYQPNIGITLGGLYSGTVLRYAGLLTSGGDCDPSISASYPAGTWRAMGYAAANSIGRHAVTIFKRVS